MNLAQRTIIFIANLTFGENFFILTTLCLLLFSIILLVFSICFKRLRLIKKSVVISIALLVYALCFTKTLCQIYAFNLVDLDELIFCSLVGFFEILTLAIFCLLPTKKLAYTHDNEVIQGLFKNNDLNFSKKAERQSNVLTSKKIERLQTKKMFSDSPSFDFNLNYPYLLKRIEGLDTSNLSSLEKAETVNLKTMIEQFSYKELTDFEREKLCDGIRKFLKFSANSDEFLHDKF